MLKVEKVEVKAVPSKPEKREIIPNQIPGIEIDDTDAKIEEPVKEGKP